MSNRFAIPADPKISDLCVVFDQQEKTPFDLARFGFKTTIRHLTTGDMTIEHLEDHIALERKSLVDLVACCGNERDRFERELRRLQAYRCRAVIVEAGWGDLEMGEWKSKITSKSVVSSVLGWTEWGIPFILAGSREKAQEYTAKLLFISARRRWRELRGLINSMDTEEQAEPVGSHGE